MGLEHIDVVEVYLVLECSFQKNLLHLRMNTRSLPPSFCVPESSRGWEEEGKNQRIEAFVDLTVVETC